jgi:hypothetical protein
LKARAIVVKSVMGSPVREIPLCALSRLEPETRRLTPSLSPSRDVWPQVSCFGSHWISPK